MSVELLTEQHLEFLSLKGGLTGLSESSLVKVQHCWKSHNVAQIFITRIQNDYYMESFMTYCVFSVMQIFVIGLI